MGGQGYIARTSHQRRGRSVDRRIERSNRPVRQCQSVSFSISQCISQGRDRLRRSISGRALIECMAQVPVIDVR